MKVSKKKIKERSTTELQKENNDILDQNSSIDDLSVDKKQYLTEASNINDDEKFKNLNLIIKGNKSSKTGIDLNTKSKIGNWNTFFNSFAKTAIEKPKEVSMKEIELRITSVIKDFEETSNPRKRIESLQNLESEKKNFVPNLVGKFNTYKFINPNAKNIKKSTTLSFLRGIANKNRSNNLIKTVTALGISNPSSTLTIVPNKNECDDKNLVKVNTDGSSNTIEPSNEKIRPNKSPAIRKMTIENNKNAYSKNNEIGVSNLFAKSTMFISIVQDYLTNELIEKFKKKVKTYDQEKEVIKYFGSPMLPLEHFFHFDKIKEDLEVAKGLRNFLARNKIYGNDFIVNNMITKYYEKFEKHK